MSVETQKCKFLKHNGQFSIEMIFLLIFPHNVRIINKNQNVENLIKIRFFCAFIETSKNTSKN